MLESGAARMTSQFPGRNLSLSVAKQRAASPFLDQVLKWMILEAWKAGLFTIDIMELPPAR